MGSRAGAPGEIIALPKGGGAISGLGEKFAPDLYTGTGNFTVPVLVPAGRNGFQPDLKLVYSTGGGNGAYGHGWSLSLQEIRRKTSTGIPVYDKKRDVFVLSGSEDLVAVGGDLSKSTLYRPRTEGMFARITHLHSPAADAWEVRAKDGTVHLYQATIADPADAARIFAWKISQSLDAFGNRIEYIYQRDAIREDGPHRWDQLYLSEIRYVDFAGAAAPKYLASVRFTYEPRPDPFSEYRSGFEIRTVRRCSRISVFTHADTEILLRTYDLIYRDRPANGLSVLSRLQVTGFDGAQTERLPPLEFGYVPFEPQSRKFSVVGGAQMPSASLANPSYELVDLDGCGLPGVLQMNGIARYWRNLGDGRFDLPRTLPNSPSFALADPGVQILDADGDSHPDLVITTPTLSGYFPLEFEAGWNRRSFQRYPAAPSFSFKDPQVRLLDLDGDGITDALRSGTRLECYFHDPRRGWADSRFFERRAAEVFPNLDFADARVKWGDLTGDGLTDVMLIHDGAVEYWPNLGYGAWGSRITMRNSPRYPAGYDPKRILVGDVDGDGAADIVYLEDRKVTLWINQSGNGWSDPIVIEGTPPLSDFDAVRLVDLQGTGISGILWSRDLTALARETMFFLDFADGVKPYLLNSVDNRSGAVTRVEYAPSTHFYLADQKRRQTRWRTSLPFPVQVVARVEVIDALSGGKLTTEYSYHHGYWDGEEREFRGFGRVDQRDTEVFERYSAPGLHQDAGFAPIHPESFSPPMEVRTWFHQGAIGDGPGDWREPDFTAEFWAGDPDALARPAAITGMLKGLPPRDRRDALRALRGSVLRSEMYALDGTPREALPYTVTESLFGVREVAPGSADQRIFFPHKLAERTTQWERGSEPMTQFAFTGDYDDFGQPRLQIAAAVPRGRDYRAAALPGEPYVATATAITYAFPRDDGSRYIGDRVARVTSFEILNDGSRDIFALRDGIVDQSLARRITGQSRHYYDRDASKPQFGAFLGLPFRQLGDFGALVRTESLVLTPDVLTQAYALKPPPYLASAPPAWTAEYPAEFRTLLPPLAGYTLSPGGPDPEDAAGYFAQTSRARYDFHNASGAGRGLTLARRDPFGNETTIAYDAFDLLEVAVTDPAGMTTSAVHDYRVLQPWKVTDPNGNSSVFAFSPAGLLQARWVRGKGGEGDQLKPSVRMEYDFAAFDQRGEPILARTIRRLHHDADTSVPLAVRDEVTTVVEYSDGLGRLLQTRTQAEAETYGNPMFGGDLLPADQSDAPGSLADVKATTPGGPRVVVSGSQRFDNKGRTIEKYEPFFSSGWDYAAPGAAELHQKVEAHYDPRGHPIRMVNPDGSERRLVYGVPPELANPDVFQPTPWEAYTYDPNDNAGRTHAAASAGYQHHWNTPASIVLDALGRTVLTVERNREWTGLAWSAIQEYTTASVYDIDGNLLAVTDALGRTALRQVHDLAGHVLRIESIDAGVRQIVIDAAGGLIERRDAKGGLALKAQDALQRPIRLWGRDRFAETVTLRERNVYGDAADSGFTAAQAAAANLRGRVYCQYDEAGRLTFEQYDFKGNALEKVRRVIADSAIFGVFTPTPADWDRAVFRVDWPASETLLDSSEYRTSVAYDALNRVVRIRYPADVTAARREFQPSYNSRGLLAAVSFDGTAYLGEAAYDAGGRQTLAAFGNGVMTRRAYDADAGRLLRQRTEPFTRPDSATYRPGAILQDLGYEFDLMGNPLAIHDRTPASGVPTTVAGRDALDRTFIYEPLYRLQAASGRECDTPLADPPWDDAFRCQDPTLTRAYGERYTYDRAGNMQQVVHSMGAAGAFKRLFTLAGGGNRLASVVSGATTFTYVFDAAGNMTAEAASRHFGWDHANRLRAYRTQAGAAEPSVHVQYLYAADGHRVKKAVRKQGGQTEVTVYIDDVYEHFRVVQGGAAFENNELHIIDDRTRIAALRAGPALPGEGAPAVRYFATDHQGSISMTLNAAGAFVNREEYAPYGETTFGSFAHRRHRYTGKLRDEESGLYYFGARYYAPRLMRWTSCDPAQLSLQYSSRQPGLVVHMVNLYQYADANPVLKTDPDGATPIVGYRPPSERWREMKEFWNAARTYLSPPLVPLTTDRLMDIANKEHLTAGTTPGSVEENRVVGRMFQERVLRNLALSENVRFFQTNQRARRAAVNPFSKQPPRWVVPDAVGVAMGGYRNPARPEEGEIRARVDSLFVEMKAVKGVITLDHSNWQILGMIDALAHSPASGSQGQQRPFPTIVFVTTADTIIGPDVIQEATGRGVAVWQQFAFTRRNTIQLGEVIPLNPSVYPAGSQPLVAPVMQIVGPLHAPGARTPVDPDPTEVRR